MRCSLKPEKGHKPGARNRHKPSRRGTGSRSPARERGKIGIVSRGGDQGGKSVKAGRRNNGALQDEQRLRRTAKKKGKNNSSERMEKIVVKQKKTQKEKKKKRKVTAPVEKNDSQPGSNLKKKREEGT